ncbi:MAG: nitroreductase family protein [Dehalococcoidia bacterium]|nr:nitroreductase family protein [Dehalococcoidia bacterium]
MRSVSEAIAARRSVRRFAARPVDPELVRELVALACTAPAPHHSRPWRFVNVASRAGRERLAEAMAEAWLADLQQAGRPVQEVDRLLRRSRGQILEAPALVLSCLVLDQAKEWPDARRAAAERDMFMQSLGAALQNILLAAGERGLAGYLKGAPLFCAGAVRQALDLPPGWEPAFLALLGYTNGGATAAAREPVDAADFLLER